MGLGGNSFGSLLLIFLISVVLFGTKRLKSIGSDLGAAIKSFREGMDGEKPSSSPSLEQKHSDSPTEEAKK
jgi:sec-independent protein translocase protein TatA